MSILDRLEKSKKSDVPDRYNTLMAEINHQMLKDFHLDELNNTRLRAEEAESKLNAYLAQELTSSAAVNSLNEKISSLESELRSGKRKLILNKEHSELEEKELKAKLQESLDENKSLEIQLAEVSGRLSQAENIKPIEITHQVIPSFEFDTIRDGSGKITKVTAKPMN